MRRSPRATQPARVQLTPALAAAGAQFLCHGVRRIHHQI